MPSPTIEDDNVMARTQVMVVEDEGVVALSLQQKLRGLGYEVPAIVATGEQALQRAAELRPDLILMDIMLAGALDGIEAAHQIRARLDVPIIYLTAYSDDHTIERAKLTEPLGYLLKPFEDQELRITIEIALYKHRMERKLKENEQWLATTLKSIGDAIIATDERGAVKFLNPVAETLVGWSQQESLGKAVAQVFRIFDVDTGAPLENPIDRVLRQGRTVGLDNHTLLVGRDGTERSIDDSAAPIKDERGHILGTVLVFRDITEKRQLEMELRRHRDHLQQLVDARTRELQQAKEAAEAANRAKSEFLATMSHEIRTPLNGALGMAELLLETTLDEKQQRYLKTLLQSGHSLRGIIDDILDFSKIEVGKLELRRLEFDLCRPVEETAALLAEQARAKGLTLRTEIARESAIRVWGDPERLRQILTNLVGNAIKFTEQGEIVIRLRLLEPVGREIAFRIEVADTGIGIEPAMQDTIFDTFAQADGSVTRRYGGTGLGLAICKRLVRLMEGEIGVESEVGQGSRFWFTARLTRSNPSDEAERPTRPPPVRENVAFKFDAKILVVEDNPVNQEVAVAMLELLGCQTTIANDGREALTALGREHYDLVLMDYHMPGLDGFATTAELRRREAVTGDARLPVIALTAGVVSGFREQCLAAGMDDYLSKPFERQQLMDVLARWLPPTITAKDSAPSSPAPGSSSPSEPAGPCLDQRTLNGIRALQRPGAPDLLGKLVALYFESAPDLLQRMREATNRSDPEDLRQAAHALKSSSANLGALSFAALCKELEERGRSRQLDNITELLVGAETQYTRVREALLDETRKVPR